MIEEYWLFVADNECLHESLYNSMQKDIENGEYPPLSFEELVELFDNGDDLDEDDFLSDFNAENCYDEDDLLTSSLRTPKFFIE